MIAPHPASARAPALGAFVRGIEQALAAPPAARTLRMTSALRAALAMPGLVPNWALVGRADGYARHVIHADPGGAFTILSLVWGAGQMSRVHAHDAWCAYVVTAGVLHEELYGLATPEERPRLLRGLARPVGYACHAEAGRDFIHALGGPPGGGGRSIHVYGVDEAGTSSRLNHFFG